MNNINIKEESIEFKVGKALCRKKLTISTVESCTGGMVAASLISYPGISEVYLEGAVTYSNESKMKRVNVSKATLETFGAVSEETAREMATGIAMASGSKVGISTTGIAGPGGGTDEKPVGLVYIGIYVKGKVKVNKYLFSGDRSEVREQSTKNALMMLLDEIGE